MSASGSFGRRGVFHHLRLDYFFGPDVDVEWADELIAFDDQVGREDTALVESAQRGAQGA